MSQPTRTKRSSLHGNSTARELLKQVEHCENLNPRELCSRWFEFLSYLDKNDLYSPNDLRTWFCDSFLKEVDETLCRKEEYYGRCYILYAKSFIKQENLLQANRVFESLYVKRIGIQNAYVYRAHSELLQMSGSKRKAAKIISKGIDNRAQPFHLLDFQDVTRTITPGTSGGLSDSDSDVELTDATTGGEKENVDPSEDVPGLVDVDTYQHQSFMSRGPGSLGPPTRVLVENDDTGDDALKDEKKSAPPTSHPFMKSRAADFATPRVSSTISALHSTVRKRKARDPPITPSTITRRVGMEPSDRLRFRSTSSASSSIATDKPSFESRSTTANSLPSAGATRNNDVKRNGRLSHIPPILEDEEARDQPSPPEVSRSLSTNTHKDKSHHSEMTGGRHYENGRRHAASVGFDEIVGMSSARQQPRETSKEPRHSDKPRSSTSSSSTARDSGHQQQRQVHSSLQKTLPRPSSSSASHHPHQQKQQPQQRSTRSSAAPQQKRSSSSSHRKYMGHMPNAIFVNNRKYVPLLVVGRGGSGLVFKVISDDRSILALKQIAVNFDDDASLENYRNEISLLEKLKGKPHTIIMHDYMEDPKHGLIYMVFEFGEIDLAHILKRKNPSGGFLTDILEIQLYWKQMLVAVSVIHDERIVHGDLKPANFLCVEGELKLIDFGIAKAIQNNDTTNIYRDAQIGTLNYMSPEAIIEHTENAMEYKLGRSADMWSLGCILHQICFGKTPFSHLKTVAKIHAITNQDQPIQIQVHENEHINEIIRSCLRRDPTQRPSLDELLDHPFLKGGTGRHGSPPSSSARCSLRYLEEFFSSKGYHIRTRDLEALAHEINDVRMFRV